MKIDITLTDNQGRKYQSALDDMDHDCTNCAFFRSRRCNHELCSAANRYVSDSKIVIFKEIKL